MRQIHAFLQTRDGVKQYFLSLFCYRNFRTDNVGFESGIAALTQKQLDRIVEKINNRPRKVLGQR
jgi:hypothetical protein